MRVGLFVPCYVAAFHPEVGVATLELLERLDCEVDYPLDQTCCGQPMTNTGCHAEPAATEALFVANFPGYDYVVGSSGSCVHQVSFAFDAIRQTDEVRHVRARTFELVAFCTTCSRSRRSHGPSSRTRWRFTTTVRRCAGSASPACRNVGSRRPASFHRLQPAGHLGVRPRDAACAQTDLPPVVSREQRAQVSARDDILAAIRAHAPKLDRPDPIPPSFDGDPPADLTTAFAAALEYMGGEWLQPGDADPVAVLRARLAGARIVCSLVPEVEGNRTRGLDTEPADLADVDVGVVRASFAVAETGSVCLTDEDLGINTLGYLSQHLIVLLDPADIVANIHHAYRRPEWRRSQCGLSDRAVRHRRH